MVALVGLLWAGFLYDIGHGEPRAPSSFSFLGALASMPPGAVSAAASAAGTIGSGLLSVGAASMAYKQWASIIRGYRGQSEALEPMATSSSNRISAFKRLRGFRFFRKEKPNQASAMSISNDPMDLTGAAAVLPPGAIIENPWAIGGAGPQLHANFPGLNTAAQNSVPSFTQFNPQGNIGVPADVTSQFNNIGPNNVDFGLGHIHLANRPGQLPSGLQQHVTLTAPRPQPQPQPQSQPQLHVGQGGRGSPQLEYTEFYGGGGGDVGSYVEQPPSQPQPHFGLPAQATPQSPRPPRPLQPNVAYRPPTFPVYNEVPEQPAVGPVQPAQPSNPPQAPPQSQPLGSQFGPYSARPPARPVAPQSEEPRELPSPNYLPQPPRTQAQRAPVQVTPNRTPRLVYSNEKNSQLVPSVEYYAGKEGNTPVLLAPRTPSVPQAYNPSTRYESRPRPPQGPPSAPGDVKPKYSKLLQNADFKPSSGPVPQRTQVVQGRPQVQGAAQRPAQAVRPQSAVQPSQTQSKSTYASPYSPSYSYSVSRSSYQPEYKALPLRQVSSSMQLQASSSEEQAVTENPVPEYRVLEGSIRLLGHLGMNGAAHLNGPINVNGVEGLVTFAGQLAVPVNKLEATGQINIQGLISNFTLHGASTPEGVVIVNGRVNNPEGYKTPLEAYRQTEDESSPNSIQYPPANVQQILLNGTQIYYPGKESTIIRLNGTIGLLGAVSPASVRVVINDDGVIRVDAMLGVNSEERLEQQIKSQLDLLKRQLAMSLMPRDPVQLASQYGLTVSDGVAGGNNAAIPTR